MTCPELPPYLIAYADQRMACCAKFLDRMIANEREYPQPGSISWAQLSNALDDVLTAPGAMSDALALAIQRLAKGGTP